MRLARYLSQAGVASRRKSEELIAAGRVSVNGKKVTNVATNVDPDSDRVSVDGGGVQLQDLVYVLLNKPKGCVSTTSDPEGRATVMDYLPKIRVAVKPVGRLDYNSEGVLLMTNDGDLAAALLSSKHHVDKTYHVKVDGRLSDAAIEKLRAGVVLDDGRRTKPAQVDRLKTASKHDWLVVTLQEGRNRQIHRMLEAVGHRVSKIQRVAFAGLTFHGLRVGDARELDAAELKSLRRLVGLKPNPRSSTRGKWKAKREDSDRSRAARAKKLEEAQASGTGSAAKPGSRSAAAPKGRAAAPKGRAASPKGRAAAPKGRAAAPKGRAAAPKGRAAAAPAKGRSLAKASPAKRDTRVSGAAQRAGGRKKSR